MKDKRDGKNYKNRTRGAIKSNVFVFESQNEIWKWNWSYEGRIVDGVINTSLQYNIKNTKCCDINFRY